MAKKFRIELDAVIIKDLASIMCTTEEIAFICKCSKDTIERRFMDVLHEGRANAKASLRRLQWRSAEGGSVPMQIWLGKQYLGQTEKQEFITDDTKPQGKFVFVEPEKA